MRLILFRNREAALKVSVPLLHYFLQRQQRDYCILLVEQVCNHDSRKKCKQGLTQDSRQFSAGNIVFALGRPQFLQQSRFDERRLPRVPVFRARSLQLFYLPRCRKGMSLKT